MMDVHDFIHISEDGINIESLLQVKNWMTPNPFCMNGNKTIKEAAEVMIEHRIDGLPIVNDDSQLMGIITLRQALSYFLNGHQGQLVESTILDRHFAKIQQFDSLLDVFSLPFDQFLVVDSTSKLLGILTKRDVLDGFSKYIHKLKQRQNSAEALNIILESAYEGIAVVDENGILQEFNHAYSRFTGIKRVDAIGRHVSEVIENTNLHITVKTAIPERGVIQNIQGQDMVVHRIPILKEEKVVGAIGMLIFEGVTDIYKIYEKLQVSHVEGQMVERPFTLNKEKDSRMTLAQIIGVSDSLTMIKRLARKAARTSATILITGESGTGKEMFAKSIHHLSPFATGPFISVNCGAIPEHLFESELFGYEEGAFSGAKKGGKPGKFELADKGTIFLDEIGELPLMLQTKLLRVLQEKEAERVGGIKKYQMNVRVIAATNRDLKEMVEKGEFREDLFYRLNIIHLHIPPLRERRQDIPILLSYYVKEICDKYQMQTKSFTREAISAFMDYEWRGNIREMVNTIERLVTLVDGPIIELKDLLHSLTGFEKRISKEATALNMKGVLEEAKLVGHEREKELIIKMLKNAGGNKSKAAELLGIHRTTLYQKLKKYGL
ncbi:Fis family transcriptional regulator [Bacillus sp. SA1-12]|uniref:sigma-54-dependent Fis family transcriptional regulator n=1 Tax=Bacillus sp. SA1-12 TaxID=1455638 RepID=UPI0006273B0E|nr:sigma-54-dependent Fis family transcriptional regulator [Bacillus sp. SA1-12]KKI89562.1 Fis family transcriptional regulator [Bacillus sp. SA1-12]